MKKIVSFFYCFLLMYSINAQRVCGSLSYLNKMGVPQYNQQELINASQNLFARDTFSNELITIPVVFHILYNNSSQNISNAQLQSQLKVLNEDYRRWNSDSSNTPHAFKPMAADCNIMFCLAQINPSGMPTTGIIRKYTNRASFAVDDAVKYSAAGGDDAWDSKKYLNIWVCNLSGGVLGYSTTPGMQADKDGVVIQYDAFGTVGNVRAQFNKGRTATHEVGHWLGLLHIWGDQKCGTDYVADTPSQSDYNSNCPSFPHVSDCSPNSNGDMFMNFMDYTNDACMNMFTYGQKNRMRSLFATNGIRNTFLKSYVCDSSLAMGASIPSDTLKATNNTELLNSNLTIYPNPVQSFFELAPKNGYEIIGKTIVIYNLSGKVVLKRAITNATEKINMLGVGPGIYFLKVLESDDNKMYKLVKI